MELEMRVRVLTFTAGNGHNQVAKSLKASCEARGIDCEIIDVVAIVSPLLKDFINSFYNFSVNSIPKIYRFLYLQGDKKTEESYSISLNAVLQSITADTILTRLIHEVPDVLIATHPFAAALVHFLKERRDFKGLGLAVITDYTVHPYWQEARDLDYYITPSDLMGPLMKRKGLDPQAMLPFGIPIFEKFSAKVSREEARRDLGLPEDRRYVLLLSGSMAHVPVVDVIRELDELEDDFEILLMLNKERRGEKEVQALTTRHTVRCQGFTDKIDRFYQAADVIISKPGGITLAETLAVGRPLILMSPIPGQEERNVEYMLNNQLAVFAHEHYPLSMALHGLLSREAQYRMLEENMRREQHGDANPRLLTFLEEELAVRAAMEPDTAATEATEPSETALEEDS